MSAGFTIVELVVVAAIIAVLSIVVILGQSSFSRTILLSTTAADIALTLRNAQIYGIGSRTIGVVSNAGYGLDFDSAAPGSFVFFADTDPAAACVRPNCTPGNGYFISGADSLVQTFTLNNRMEISNFCAFTLMPATSYCKTGGANSTQHLSIVFTRPNTTAVFGVGNVGAGATTTGGVPFTVACVKVSSPEGATRSLFVNQVGEISATSTCP